MYIKVHASSFDMTVVSYINEMDRVKQVQGHETCEKEEYIVYNQIGTPNLPRRHKVRRAFF